MSSLPLGKLPRTNKASGPDVDRLLTAARDGCGESLGELTERYRRYLLLVAHQELSPEFRQKVSPSDLVQETFLHLQGGLQRFAGTSEEELVAWLRKILHFRALMAVRRHRTASRDISREVPLCSADDSGVAWLPADAAPSPSSRSVARERVADVNRGLASLSESYKAVIVLRNVERLSFRDIGLSIGCTPAAAQQRWLRAIAQLRRHLSSHES
jgi:RNA polymerase sigma-70 factor, ECF subfamily